MQPEVVKRAVGDTPFMSLDKGRRITSFIGKHDVRHVLELGFAHGVSTCYLAAAVKDRGGSVTTIDRESARERQPNVHELLRDCGLEELVKVHFEPRSFTWRLMRMLESVPQPRFDLVYLDGGHSWDVTGFAFFLVDRLLRPGGWLIFDDVDWTYAASPTRRDSAQVKQMPEDYKNTPQVRKVFELLVVPHRDYRDCRIRGGWAYARKRRGGRLSQLRGRIEALRRGR